MKLLIALAAAITIAAPAMCTAPAHAEESAISTAPAKQLTPSLPKTVTLNGWPSAAQI
jgi:hypothetical protein